MEHGSDITERLVRIEESLKNLGEEFDEMKDELFGNGQPGKITLIENRISELEKTLYKILGAVALGVVLVNILVAIWPRH